MYTVQNPRRNVRKIPTISRPLPVQDKDIRYLYPMDFMRSDSISSVASSATAASYLRDVHQDEGDGRPIGGAWIELFYDLFFAASLSAFSKTREISGQKALVDLAAFFSILWWTWASQTLFDVRYARHNKLEAASKFLQLLIMIGYGVFEANLSLFMSSEMKEAMSATATATTDISPRHRSGPRTSTIAIISIFVLSRLLLAAQYFSVALRRQRSMGHLVKSSLISAALPLLAAMFWVASLFVLESTVGKFRMYALRTGLWLAGILVEMVGTFVLRLHKSSGFEKTHLTERFGSLTIILLGEGVIKLVTVLRDISSGVGFEFRSGVAIATSIVSFYLIWALYFDGRQTAAHNHVRSSKAYHWAYTHFAFHLSLVLLLEDITSLLLFQNLYGGMNALLDPARENGILADLFQLERADGSSVVLSANLTIGLHADGSMTHMNGTALSHSEFDYLFINLFGRIFDAYNIDPPEAFDDFVATLDPRAVRPADVDAAFKLLLKQFVTSAQFFLIAAGVLFLTLIPITLWRSPFSFDRGNGSGSGSKRRRLVWIGRLSIGLGLLVGAASVDSRGERLGRALVSGGLIPAFMSVAGVVYILDRFI